MTDLEQRLSELRIEWPPTPDIAGNVHAAIVAHPQRGLTPIATKWSIRRRRGQTPIAWGVAALLVAVAVVEPARSAVLEFLGLKAAKIERRSPDAPPVTTPRAPLGADLGLGRRVTLAQAAKLSGFAPAVPPGLGEPGAVYVDDQVGVSLVYPASREFPESAQTGAGLLITQVRGQVTPYIRKAAGAGTRVERLTIDGDVAYFLSGDPHGFAYESYAGDVRFEDQRLAGNTLLVEHDDVLVRIEGEIPRSRAVEIAGSITATLDP